MAADVIVIEIGSILFCDNQNFRNCCIDFLFETKHNLVFFILAQEDLISATVNTENNIDTLQKLHNPKHLYIRVS